MNHYIHTSKLHIRTKKGLDKNYLEHVEFTTPFKITKPFYDGENHMKVMVISVSAGIMEGDHQEILLEVLENSEVTITSQSYEKIHKMKEGSAKRETKIVVEKGGYLNYSPLPCIPFEDSAFENDTAIYLKDDTARLVYSEILACGRVAREELFQYRLYKALTKIYCGKQLIYYDNANYEPQKQDMLGFCMYEGFTHLLNMVLVHMSINDEKLARIREIIAKTKGVEGGATYMQSKDVCVRVLGNGSEKLLEIQKKVMELL